MNIHTYIYCMFFLGHGRGVGSGEDVKVEGKTIRKRGRLGDEYYQHLLHVCVKVSQMWVAA